MTPALTISTTFLATDPTSTGLSASNQVNTASQASGGQIVVLNTAAHTVANQAQFPAIPAVPGLAKINDHLTAAQGHANNWLNTYSQQVLSTLQGVITFGELYQNLYATLYAAAQAMGTETGFQPNEISSLIGQITALQGQVKSQGTAAQLVYTDLTTYSTSVGADLSVFNTDYNTANIALGGASGLLQLLQNRIDADNTAMLKDALMIAGGSVMMVTGVLCFVAGVAGAVESGGASIALAAGGVALMGGGGAVTGLGAKDYDAKMADYADAQMQMASAKAELALLATLKTGFTNINSQLMTTQTALQGLVTAWQELDNGMDQVLTSLNAPETYLATLKQVQPTATPALVSIIISAEIKTANDDWTSSVQLASTLLANLRGAKFLVIATVPTIANMQAAYTQSLAA